MIFCLNFYMNDNFEDFVGFLYFFFLNEIGRIFLFFFVKLNLFLESMVVYIDQIDFESKNIKNEIYFFFCLNKYCIFRFFFKICEIEEK